MISKLRMGFCACFIFAACAFSSCSSINYKVAEQMYNYNKDISVDVLKLNSVTGQGTGMGRLLPPRKHVFIYLTILVKNNSNSNQVVDLTKIVLLNLENRTKYSVGRVLLPTLVLLQAKDDLAIKPNEQVKRILMFNYPQKLKPEWFEINGKAEQFSYPLVAAPTGK